MPENQDAVAIAAIQPTLRRAVDDIRELTEHLQQNDSSVGALARSVESALLHLRYAQEGITDLTAAVDAIEKQLTLLPQQHAHNIQVVLQTVVTAAMESVVQTVQAAKDADTRATQAAAQAAQADAKITAMQATLTASEAVNTKMRLAARKQLLALIGTVLAALVSLLFGGLIKG